jgi:hypothetical protein
MRMMIAAKEKAVLAQNCLNRKIQWYVKQLLLSFGPDGPYESGRIGELRTLPIRSARRRLT